VSMFNWATFCQTTGAVKSHLLLGHDGYLPVYAHLTEGNGWAPQAKRLRSSRIGCSK
jgi:hypothetical protein